MPNTFQTVMAELASAFVSGTRDSGEAFYKLRDDAPAWLQDEAGRDVIFEIHKAVDDRFPDDWIYEHTMRIAGAFESEDVEDKDSADVHETAAAFVDVYTNALTAWLASHLGNVALCDEAHEEYGEADDNNLVTRISRGQHMALERIAYAVLEVVEAEAEARDEAAEASDDAQEGV